MEATNFLTPDITSTITHQAGCNANLSYISLQNIELGKHALISPFHATTETKQHHVAAETFHKPCLPQSNHTKNYSHDIHIYEDISSGSGHNITVKAVTCVSYSEAERSCFPEGFPMLRPPIQYSLYYTQHLNPSMNSL